MSIRGIGSLDNGSINCDRTLDGLQDFLRENVVGQLDKRWSIGVVDAIGSGFLIFRVEPTESGGEFRVYWPR